jgi:curved DNA-binding protein CbpA
MIGDWVAVKVLHPDQMADPQAVERFRRRRRPPPVWSIRTSLRFTASVFPVKA